MRKGWAYEVDEGGGAFYGPKIDLKIKDALGHASLSLGGLLAQKTAFRWGMTHLPGTLHRFVRLFAFFAFFCCWDF